MRPVGYLCLSLDWKQTQRLPAVIKIEKAHVSGAAKKSWDWNRAAISGGQPIWCSTSFRRAYAIGAFDEAEAVPYWKTRHYRLEDRL